MELKDLVGEIAIRTKPIANGDYSYTSCPVRVAYVDEYNGVIEHVCDPILDDVKSVLDCRYVDDGWRKRPKEIAECFQKKGIGRRKGLWS